MHRQLAQSGTNGTGLMVAGLGSVRPVQASFGREPGPRRGKHSASQTRPEACQGCIPHVYTAQAATALCPSDQATTSRREKPRSHGAAYPTLDLKMAIYPRKSPMAIPGKLGQECRSGLVGPQTQAIVNYKYDIYTTR